MEYFKPFFNFLEKLHYAEWGFSMVERNLMQTISVPIKESVMFHVGETEFQAFAALIKHYKIEHHPIMIERAEARFYLYHPGHHLVMTAMAQAVIRYRELKRTELSFTEWRDAYVLNKKSWYIQ